MDTRLIFNISTSFCFCDGFTFVANYNTICSFYTERKDNMSIITFSSFLSFVDKIYISSALLSSAFEGAIEGCLCAVFFGDGAFQVQDVVVVHVALHGRHGLLFGVLNLGTDLLFFFVPPQLGCDGVACGVFVVGDWSVLFLGWQGEPGTHRGRETSRGDLQHVFVVWFALDDLTVIGIAIGVGHKGRGTVGE